MAEDEFGGKRATTDEKKRIICDRLYLAWCIVPNLRLGQLVVDAVGEDPFYKEDEDLIVAIEHLPMLEKAVQTFIRSKTNA